MSDEHIDQVLADLAAVVEQFRAEYLAVNSLAERLDDEAERRLEERAARSTAPTTDITTPMPRETLHSLQCRLAQDSARQHREAFRGLVAWWADAAMVAVLFSAHGQKPNAVRVAAGDPYSWMTTEDLEHLPPIPEHDRKLAELGVFLAGGPALPGDPHSDDFAAKTQEHFESLGLKIQTDPDGEPTLVEDGFPEARRRRLWGGAWQEHRMPLLVETTQLTEFLAQLGVPSETVDAISKVSTAVEAVRETKIRIAKLEAQLQDEELSGEAEKAAITEIDQSLSVSDVTDDRLIEYAQTLTASLPVIRASKIG
ncbi:hypothetical protein E1287_27225 [Actinomadura sp. KC06]|uniref:hypothetical protein n=1 Tax=Actinomadura sp. KC06 TaxID=2530369 RepID=UPI00104D8037|nr:hypothetical protein [Actinomadura sp. KC06]TDD31212.1 hypothetical protein E1287_27225 [Actinomadura sp. KC06]